MASENEENYFAAAPTPPTAVGRRRALAPKASVHVSPLCLGAMTIGDQYHKIGFGEMTKDMSFKMLDTYFDSGGNFIDIANNYQDEVSEIFIGEWMEKRGIRDQLVITTKYSIDYKRGDKSIPMHHHVNFLGNNKKSMHVSLKDSLRKLRTDYVDIFYIHWWDYETSIQEVMDSLHNLVVAGKVLYLGASDCPAWVVAQCNQYALDHGKTPFAVYQGSWNVLDRSFERDIIPMCRDHGMAICPWNILAGGKIRSDAEEERRLKSGENGRDFTGAGWLRTEAEAKASRALEKVAKEIGVESITAVAIAYLMHKTPNVFPIIGARKTEHMLQNFKAVEISLTPEQVKFIDSINDFDPGFPHNFIGNGTENNAWYQITAQIDRVKYPSPISPVKQ